LYKGEIQQKKRGELGKRKGDVEIDGRTLRGSTLLASRKKQRNAKRENEVFGGTPRSKRKGKASRLRRTPDLTNGERRRETQ